MPDGGFSIRDWLEDPSGGNLFITLREDMKDAMKPIEYEYFICTV